MSLCHPPQSLFDSTALLHALSSPFHILLPQPMQDWLWGTPVTNSDGNRVLFSTSCSHGYCRCQPWHVDNRRECRFTVSQGLGQRDQQCTCNRQGNESYRNCIYCTSKSSNYSIILDSDLLASLCVHNYTNCALRILLSLPDCNESLPFSNRLSLRELYQW